LKYFLSLLLFVGSSCIVKPQDEISAGMGVGAVNISSLRDYVNSNFALPSERLATFNSAADFFIEYDHEITIDYHLALEYSIMISSFNSTTIYGLYDISFSMHRPSLIFYYVKKGNGYELKLGAGAGYRLVSAVEKLPASNAEPNYTGSGFGLLLKVQGNTLLSGRLYALIAADLRIDLPGEPSRGSAKIHYNSTGETVNFNAISAGVKLGVSYQL